MGDRSTRRLVMSELCKRVLAQCFCFWVRWVDFGLACRHGKFILRAIHISSSSHTVERRIRTAIHMNVVRRSPIFLAGCYSLVPFLHCGSSR